jgi:hypothetical protein
LRNPNDAELAKRRTRTPLNMPSPRFSTAWTRGGRRSLSLFRESWSEWQDLRRRSLDIGFISEIQIAHLTCVRVLCTFLKSAFHFSSLFSFERKFVVN